MATTRTATERAEAIASRARRSRNHDVKIITEEMPAEFWPSGKVMLPATRMVTVEIKSKHWSDGSAVIMFSEVLPGQGRRSVSRLSYAKGQKRRNGTNRYCNIATAKAIDTWLYVYVDTYAD